MHFDNQVQIGKLRKGVLGVFKGSNSEHEAEKLLSEQMISSHMIVKFDGGHAVITKKLHRLFIEFRGYIDENLEKLKCLNHYEVAELCATISVLEDLCHSLRKLSIDRQKANRALKILKDITKDVWTDVDFDLREKAIHEILK
ncbi:MAG: hypothetical protein GY749_04775 [Desulfobacteraceae bacterium]|nr:hypothetical protein [Desulfobacteraceae bacterium]